MKNSVIIIIAISSILSSCSHGIYESVTEHDNKAVYDEFWHHVHENYIYFREKSVDWSEVYEQYGSHLSSDSADRELFEAIESSLLELKDSHNRLTTSIGNGKVYNYKKGFDIHFSLEVVDQNYIDGALSQANIFSYGTIDASTLYVHVPTMTAIPSLRALLRRETTDQTKSIIIDLRNNAGGNSNYVPSLLSDYVTQREYLGAYIEKSGSGIDDKTPPIKIYAEPNAAYQFKGKVYLLINRVGYSATSYMAAMCKDLPNFTVVGQVTGGGGGGNAGYELSNEWIINVSVSDFVDKDNRSIELGVEPNIKIENTKEDLEIGKDVMLEGALSLR